MEINYIFYWNSHEDGKVGPVRGYKPTDELIKAYAGTYKVEHAQRPEYVLDRLFEQFNLFRPIDYFGPNMSMGSVVELNGVAWSVNNVGFSEVDLSNNAIRPTPTRWRKAAKY